MPEKSRFFSVFRYWVPSWGGIFVLLFWLVAGSFLGNLITSIFSEHFGMEVAIKYGTLVSYPVMFLPPVLYAFVRSKRKEMEIFVAPEPLDRNHFAPLGFVLCSIAVVIATVCAGIMSDAVNSLMPPMPESLKKVFEQMTGGNIIVNLICVSVMAPFFEEWLCRGTVLRGLLHNGVSPFWAIAVSAIFFGVIHMNPWQAIPAFILGMLFGYVYYKTGSLKLTMLMHCANNTLAVVLAQIPSLAKMETWLDVLGGSWYLILFTICAVIMVAFFIMMSRIPAAYGIGYMQSNEEQDRITR